MKGTPGTIKKEAARLFIVLAGFLVISTGLVLMFESNLGVPPWDVFHLGVYGKIGFLTRGQVIQGTGFFLILLSFLMGIRPHVATVLNMIFIGLYIDVIYYLDIIHISGGLPLRVLAFFSGAALMGFGTSTYMTANLGTGPRDSLMLGLTRKTGLNMGLMRTILEVSVTLCGMLLGGPFGAGTLMFALSIGFFMQAGFRFYRWLKKKAFYVRVVEAISPMEESLERSSPHA